MIMGRFGARSPVYQPRAACSRGDAMKPTEIRAWPLNKQLIVEYRLMCSKAHPQTPLFKTHIQPVTHSSFWAPAVVAHSCATSHFVAHIFHFLSDKFSCCAPVRLKRPYAPP